MPSIIERLEQFSQDNAKSFGKAPLFLEHKNSADMNAMRDAGHRLGMSFERGTTPLFAAHEAGHYLSALETGRPVSAYFIDPNLGGGVYSDYSGDKAQVRAQAMHNYISGPAAEYAITGNEGTFRKTGNLGDILQYSHAVDPSITKYSHLTPEHLDDFERASRLRADEFLQNKGLLTDVARSIHNNPVWVSPFADDNVVSSLGSAVGYQDRRPAKGWAAQDVPMPADLRMASINYVQAVHGDFDAADIAGRTRGVTMPEWTFGPGLTGSGRMAPIGHVEASQINNPLGAFRAMVAPRLNTYNSATRQGLAMGRRLGAQGPDSDIWRQISSQAGVGVSGVIPGTDPNNPQRTRTASVGGVVFGSQKGLQTTDDQGVSTAWRVRTVGGADARAIASGKSNIPGESMIEAELSAHIAAQQGDKIGGYGSVIMNRDTGELVHAQAGQGFNPDEVSPALRKKIDTIRNMTAASQGAFGLNGYDVGMRLADTGAGDAEGLGALDESIKMLSGQFMDDEQVGQIFPGLDRSDLAMGLDSPAIQNALFLQGGSPAGDLLRQSTSGTGLASIAPSAAGSGGRGGLSSGGSGLIGGGPGGGQPPKSGGGTAAAAPAGGGSGGGNKKPARTDFGDYSKHIDALTEALPRLSKVMEDATKSTSKLTDQQVSYVQSASQLYKELQSAVGDALQGGTPEGAAFAQKAMSAGFGSLGNMLHGAGDQQGLISRSFVDQFRRPVGETPPSISDRLAPFSMRGQAGKRAVQEGVESGWYGEEGSAERAAWMIGGRLSSVPSNIVHARYAMRTAQQEFLQPMEQSRQAFLKSEEQMASARLGIYGMGYAGSSEYASAVMPGIMAANQQREMGRQTQQAFGGLLGLSDRLFGTQTGAQAQGLVQTALAGGTAGMPFGPIGSVLGTAAGGVGYAAGQMADYFDPYRSDRRIAAHTAASTGDFGAVGLFDHAGRAADYAFGKVFGRTEQGQRRYNREVSAATTVSLMLGSPEQMGSQIDTLGMGDPTVSRQFITSALQKDNWLAGVGAPLKDEDRQRLGEQVYGMMGGASAFRSADVQGRLRKTFASATNIEATFGQGSTGQFVSDWATSQGLNAADVAMGRVPGAERLIDWLGDPEKGNARGATLRQGNAVAGGIRESLTRAGLKVDPTATDGMAWTDKINAAQAISDPSARAAALRGVGQEQGFWTGLGDIGMTSSLAGQSSYVNYLKGLSEDTSEAGALKFNRAQARRGLDVGLNQMFGGGYGLSAEEAARRTTGITSATGKYGEGSVKAATELALRSGFNSSDMLFQGDVAKFSQVFDAGMGEAFTQRIESAANARNIAYGSREYQEMTQQYAAEWGDKKDPAKFTSNAAASRTWEAYNTRARSAGISQMDEKSFQDLRPDNRQMVINAENAILNVKSMTGLSGETQQYQDLQKRALTATSPDDIFNVNRQAGQLGMANRALEGYARYGGATAETQSRMNAAAMGMGGQDFQKYMAVIGGDPIASSLYADAGGPSWMRQVQTGSMGGSIGLAKWTNERISATDASRRAGAGAGLVMGDGAFSAGDLSGMSQYGIENAMVAEQRRARDFDFGLQSRQLNRQQASVTGAGLGGFVAGAEGKGSWYFEDASRNLGYRQQDFGFAMGSAQITLGEQRFASSQRQWSEQFGLSARKAGVQIGYQEEDLTVGRSHQKREQQWQLEDQAFRRDVSEVNFAWGQEDFDRNIRYARGRERRDLMRQQERATISHSMQSGQMDREEGRTKERMGWSDEQFARDKRRHEQNKQWTQEEMAMQKRHHDEDTQFTRQEMALRRQSHEMERQFVVEERQLAMQKRQIDRQIAVQEMQEAQMSLRFHQESRRTLDDLTNAERVLNRVRQEDAARLQYMAQTGQLANQVLDGFISRMRAIASTSSAAPAPRPSSTTAGGGGYWSKAFADGGYTGDPGGMGSYPAFADGGYTGTGASNEVAGTVHKGEWVIPTQGGPVIRGDNNQTVAILREILGVLKDRQMPNVNMTIHGNDGKSVGEGALSVLDRAYARRNT